MVSMRVLALAFAYLFVLVLLLEVELDFVPMLLTLLGWQTAGKTVEVRALGVFVFEFVFGLRNFLELLPLSLSLLWSLLRSRSVHVVGSRDAFRLR